MNIIQVQDRLKGLPEDALVNYVKEPMGEVPIYLALGELQRRKDMKERFQASQADKPSVAEQLVAESEPMQMGLGAMAPQQMMPQGQGVGAPQPQQAVDPRQLAASGIAANPQSAVGGTAMMAKGGIVGEFTDKTGRSAPISEDGSIGFAGPGLALIPAASALMTRLGTGLASQKVGLPALMTGTSLVPRAGTSLVPVTGGATQTAAPGFFAGALDFARRRPFVTAGGVGAATTVPFLFGGDPESEDNKDDKGDGKKGAKKETAKEEKRTLEDRVKEYMDAMGTNEGLERVKGRLAEFDERAKGKRGDAANMALIEAGLNIAAGQSPDALSNIATGATAGVKGYTERLKDADAAEKEVLALDLAIGQAERTERAAAVNFGIKSIEAERAAQQKYNLMQKKAQLKAYYDSITVLPETRRKIMIDLNGEGAIDAIKERLKDSLGENRVGSDIYNQMLAQETEALVQQRALPMATNTAPEGMKQAGVTPDGRIVYEDADGKRYVGG